jgi:hypothetical protein
MGIMSGQPCYSIRRTFERGRPPWGRWEVRHVDGRLLGVVAEEPAPGGHSDSTSFTALHNTTTTPLRPPISKHLLAGRAWFSRGHDTVPEAVAALTRHLVLSGAITADS